MYCPETHLVRYFGLHGLSYLLPVDDLGLYARLGVEKRTGVGHRGSRSALPSRLAVARGGGGGKRRYKETGVQGDAAKTESGRHISQLSRNERNGSQSVSAVRSEHQLHPNYLQRSTFTPQQHHTW